MHLSFSYPQRDHTTISKMSRHKLVKALNLDEELDDFDGVEEDGDEEEELSPEDKGTSPLRSCFVGM